MDILNTILKDTYSLTQIKHRVRILKDYLLKTFFGNTQAENLSEQDLKWLKLLPKEFYRNFSKDNIYTIFDSLEQQLGKLNPLTIYLTFEPDEITLTEIGNYGRNLWGNYLILDIKINRELIAGCALVWKGIYKDYSLRAQIEAKKDQILESFKKYLR